MKLSRVILVCTLLLSAAVPTFAAPPCQFCLSDAGPCVNDSNGLRCRTLGGVCTESGGLCISSARSMLAEWQVASIEITRPDPATHKTLTTVVVNPTAIAQGVTPLLPARR